MGDFRYPDLSVVKQISFPQIPLRKNTQRLQGIFEVWLHPLEFYGTFATKRILQPFLLYILYLQTLLQHLTSFQEDFLGMWVAFLKFCGVFLQLKIS